MIRGARSVALEAGWVSPEYGVKHAAPVVSAVAVRVLHATAALRHLPRAVSCDDRSARPPIPRVPAPRRAPAPGDDGGRVLAAAARRRARRRAASGPTSSTASATACASSTATAVGEQTTFAAARSGRSDGVPAPEVDAALYPVPARPQARKRLPRLPSLRSPGRLGRRRAVRDRRSSTAPYAKVQRGDGERRGLRALARPGRRPRPPHPRRRRTASSSIEALPGRSLDDLRDRTLGKTPAGRSHNTIRGTGPSLSFSPGSIRARLATAAEVIARGAAGRRGRGAAAASSGSGSRPRRSR